MPAHRKKRLASVSTEDESFSRKLKLASATKQRKSVKRKKACDNASEERNEPKENQSAKPTCADDAHAENEPPEVAKERQAREEMFEEFKGEYHDIVEELPREFNRNLILIGEMEASVQECRQELHEDLCEYMRFAQRTVEESNSDHLPVLSTDASIEDEDLANRLLTLAQPMLWGIASIRPMSSPVPCNLPEELRILLSEISKKMCRLRQLSLAKLNLAETVYEGLDRHLKRLDADLERYQDLEDQDEEAERRHEREGQNQARLPPSHQGSHMGPQSDFAIPSESSPDPLALTLCSDAETLKRGKKKIPISPLAKTSFSAEQTSSKAISFQDIHEDQQSPQQGPGDLVSPHPKLLSSPRIPRSLRSASLPMRSPLRSAQSHQTDQVDEGAGSFVPTAINTGTATLTDYITSQTSPTPQRATGASSSPAQTTGRRHRKSDIETVTISGENITADLKSSQGDEGKLYCYCKRESFGDMVACDNVDCQSGEWFHLECIGLSFLPDAIEWYCDICAKKLNGNEIVHKRQTRRHLT
ncbi:hypothetical protein O181_018386 [Austropuccinia psidii MF-1]|uniref:Chromatin modification-related protein n=1 Tax=Austropuccinia psidii MF-1 TaxID=1389203 RepID=A0A9Q3C9J2_9BASI|nr:hypothetical protein [Austropuccinia psidii MF-1]